MAQEYPRMTKQEYLAERAKVRRQRRYGTWFWEWWPPANAAERHAAYARIARQLAIEMRVARNRARREMEGRS